MNARAQVLPSGDVAIPDDVRDRLRWAPGTSLELIENADGISLRRRDAAKPFKRTKLADLGKFGPPASPTRPIEEISRLSDEAIRGLLREGD